MILDQNGTSKDNSAHRPKNKLEVGKEEAAYKLNKQGDNMQP